MSAEGNKNGTPAKQIPASLGVLLGFIMAVMLVALAIPSPASAVVDHKGLAPDTPVPDWAKHTAVHFMPWAENPSHEKSNGHSKAPDGENPPGSGAVVGEPPLMYYGHEGVQDKPHIYPIFWGSNWNKEPGAATRTQVMKMYEGLSGSAYQGILTQYFDATGRINSTVAVSPAYTDTSVAAPSNVTFKSVEEEVANAIKANGWSHDFDNQFVVLTAPGTTHKIEGYCAYHTFRKVDESGKFVALSFVPYVGDPPISEHCLSIDPEESPANATSYTASHEYTETATDPGASIEKGAWYGHNGLLHEIADMCQSTGVKLPNGSFVTPLWDDHLSECATSDSNPPFVFGVSEPPTGVTTTAATLRGTVNPEGLETKYQFEYDTTEYKNGEGLHGTKVPALMTSVGSGVNNIAQSQTLTGLPHGAIYHYRMVATNATGTTYGEDKYFETLRTKPVVQTKAATGLSTSGATLKGTVNPNGLATKYYFEYGTGPLGLKKTEVLKTAEVSIGSGMSALEVSQAVSGLAADTEYFFRIAASNADGTVNGLEATFYTGAPKNTALPVATPTVPAQAVPEAVSAGSWKGTPSTFAYQWERCTGASCEAIAGATGSSYTPVEKDVGHTLVAKVTATNTIGSTTVAANATGEVKPIGQVTEYALPAGSKPYAITSAWVDKQLWFTDWYGGKISRITTAGALTEYSLPGVFPLGIASGENITNSTIWTANSLNSSVAKFTTSGSRTEYLTPTGGQAMDIALGPESNMWFTLDSPDEIGKVTTSGTMTLYPLPVGSEPTGIVAGPDGNLWFADWGSNKIGKITPSGTITTYAVSSHPDYIAAGPDGNLWFTTGNGKAGKITTSGTVTEYTVGSAAGIVAGPDGNLWFATHGANKISRITTSGTVTSYSVAAGCEPLDITVGSDLNLWFTCFGSGKIGKITP
ncbi:MAG TPA: hypothetical protein VK471_03435 [Solirubrobacterales bacterium]|nr:hypothetical protein [Solirubrobacterales bacterium]